MFDCLIMIGNCLESSQADHTLDIESPLAFLHKAFVHYGETDLIILCQEIDFQTILCAMEVEPAIRFIVILIERNCVWIAILSVEGHNTAWSLL